MRIAPFLLAMTAGCAIASAADWLTDGYDVKRTAWQRDEKILSPATAKDIKLLWKIKLDNKPRQMHNLLPPLIVEKVNTPNGVKQILIATGVSDNLYGIDVDKGEVIWKQQFHNTWQQPAGGRGGGILCPGGITATPVIAPAGTAGKYTIYAVSWDGMLHQVNVADGEEVATPSKFMPPNGKPYALNLFNNNIYTHTAQGCGGNPNMGLHLRPQDQEGRLAGVLRAAACGDAPVPPSARTAPCTPAPATAAGPPKTASTATASSASSPTPRPALHLEDYYGPSNAEWLVKRDLDMQVTPRHLRLEGPRVDGRRRQGMPPVPHGHASPSAATITAPRCSARRSSATRTSTSPPPASGDPSPVGKIPRGPAGS